MGARLAWAILPITLLVLGGALPPPSMAQYGSLTVTITAGTPFMVSMGSYSFLNVSQQSGWSGQLSLIAFAVFKNSIGQTVAVETGGLTLAAGQVASGYVVIFNVPLGTYLAEIFVVTTNNAPVSLVLSETVTVNG